MSPSVDDSSWTDAGGPRPIKANSIIRLPNCGYAYEFHIEYVCKIRASRSCRNVTVGMQLIAQDRGAVRGSQLGQTRHFSTRSNSVFVATTSAIMIQRSCVGRLRRFLTSAEYGPLGAWATVGYEYGKK
ncbi:hypothetical protein EVAR_83588_1 [Eumeta japonica]|uniref:Uncharacterized protein n=1 Tax=Eumeta variegata TaxID=151549 RepID=A0A4C1UNP6_EUMVA|nr:hypothetical protein EVAR_83588_1 [Eumeta japonica]